MNEKITLFLILTVFIAGIIGLFELSLMQWIFAAGYSAVSLSVTWLVTSKLIGFE